LGPALTVTGADIDLIAGQSVTLLSGTTIGGTFSADLDAGACP